MDWRTIGRFFRKISFECSAWNRLPILVFGLALVFVSAIDTMAQQSPAIIRKLTLNQVSEIVSNQGWSVSKADDISIFTKFEGTSIRIGLDKSGETLMVIAVVKHNPTSMTSQKINQFNELLFGDASTFVYENNFLFVSSLGIEGGVTRDRVVSFLKSARESFEIWDAIFGV